MASQEAVARDCACRLAPSDRALLVKWARSRTLAVRVVVRSRIILSLAGSSSVRNVADTLGVTPATVRLWKRRFDELGPGGLLSDASGRGRRPALEPAVRQMLRTGRGLEEAVTVRARARLLGVSASTVSRWQRRER